MNMPHLGKPVDVAGEWTTKQRKGLFRSIFRILQHPHFPFLSDRPFSLPWMVQLLQLLLSAQNSLLGTQDLFPPGVFYCKCWFSKEKMPYFFDMSTDKIYYLWYISLFSTRAIYRTVIEKNGKYLSIEDSSMALAAGLLFLSIKVV